MTTYYILRIDKSYYTAYGTIDNESNTVLYRDAESDAILYPTVEESLPSDVTIIPLADGTTKEQAMQYTSNIISKVHTAPEKVRELISKGAH